MSKLNDGNDLFFFRKTKTKINPFKLDLYLKRNF